MTVQVRLTKRLKPLGGKPIEAGTVVSARRAGDGYLCVIGHGYLPLCGEEWEPAELIEDGEFERLPGTEGK